ncbi:MAG TPA: dihydrofolate reductase family protein [Bauldia sp.]|nr:dihydrofolate reductase family protein [Bauldia sp.]
MGKLVLCDLISLDGFIEAPNREFVPPKNSPDLHRLFIRPNLERGGINIYGRVTYEFMAAYWTSPQAEGQEAAKLTAMPKVVYSKTLQTATWANTTILRGDDLRADVARLKARTDKDLMIYGSAGLGNAFMKAGLIDEFRILINPVVLGAGRPLFQGGYGRFRLKLTGSQAFDSGAVLLSYEPERP